MEIKHIAVVGTGLMGKGIAHVLAESGYKVNLFGRRDVVGEIIDYLKKYADKGKITVEKMEDITRNISICNLNNQPELLASADLIIETVAEDMVIKKEMFEIIGRHKNNNSIVASNTSSYSITKLAQFLPQPVCFLGMHFFSPVPAMKLVEVVRGSKTEERAINAVKNVVEKIGKLAVEVKDSPGFVLNRGLFIMVNEAVCMLHEGIADNAGDIDSIFINGMGMKVGPLKLADLVGIDVVYAIMSNLYEGFKTQKYAPSPLLKKMLDDGKCGKKTREGFYKY